VLFYLAHFTINSLGLIAKLAYEIFVCELPSKPLKKKLKRKKSHEKVNKSLTPMSKVTIFISYLESP